MRRARRRLDASVRRVLEAKLRMGLFDEPYVDEDRAREVLGRPGAPRRGPDRGGAVGGAAAQRGRPAAAGRRQPRLDRGHRPARRLQARHARAVGASTSTSTRRSPCWRASAARSGEAVEVEYAPGVRPAQRVFPSMFDMFGGNAPEDPEGFDDEAELAARGRPGPRSRCRGRGGRRVAEHDRRGGVAVVAGAAGPPARAAAGRGRDRHAGRAAGDERAAARPALGGASTCRRSSTSGIPGTQGGAAVANLLFGDVSPGGKLPFTWPRTVGQVPMVYSHTRSHEPENQERRYWDEESTPLFPFGHGLSYAQLRLRRPRRRPDAIGPDETLTVSVDVTNTGDRDGRRGGPALHPPATRLGVAAGARAQGLPADHAWRPGSHVRCSSPLGPAELRYWNAAARDWVIDASTFDVWVGGDSTAELSTTFQVNKA